VLVSFACAVRTTEDKSFRSGDNRGALRTTKPKSSSTCGSTAMLCNASALGVSCHQVAARPDFVGSSAQFHQGYSARSGPQSAALGEVLYKGLTRKCRTGVFSYPSAAWPL